jgi:hypothetical protein
MGLERSGKRPRKIERVILPPRSFPEVNSTRVRLEKT